MKKTTAFMLALLFSAIILLGEAINATTLASNLCCDALVDCRGAECCNGPGTVIQHCYLECQNGVYIICGKVVEVE